MYNALNIPREESTNAWKSFCAIIAFRRATRCVPVLPEPLACGKLLMLGMYAQSLMLALTANGLASCPQTSLGFHSEVVREVLGVEPSFLLLFSISFGHEDTQDPINARISRAALAETTVFHS